MDIEDWGTREVLLLELKNRLKVGVLSEDPIDEVGNSPSLDILLVTDVNYISPVGDVKNGPAG